MLFCFDCPTLTGLTNLRRLSHDCISMGLSAATWASLHERALHFESALA